MKFLGAMLAGGASSRFGADKSLALVGGGSQTAGKPLAEIAFVALAGVGAKRIWSVGGDVARLSEIGFFAMADDYPDQGPLGGIVTALRHANEFVASQGAGLQGVGSQGAESRGAGSQGAGSQGARSQYAIFILACDLPWVNTGTLGELMTVMLREPRQHPVTSQRPQVVFPLDAQQQIQYLHGLWRLDTHDALRQAFDDGQRSVAGGLEYLEPGSVVTQQVSNPETLADADTPDDLAGG